MYRLICCIFILLSAKTVRGFLVPNGKTTVQTPVGDIVGFTTTVTVNTRQRTVRNFLGIAYAEPPVNSNRFRKPIPKTAFSSPFDASNYGHSCFQFEGLIKPNSSITFSEDCLSLNIYAPEALPSNINLYPVMIWIHGGGFTYGMSSEYDSSMLCAVGEVIVVTLNYRLNVFGFLNTNDTQSAGNYGLWDQQLAIRWVHDNIHAFGGDSNRITVFGESAGAASVIYQTLYPGNHGLFRRAIAQSGSASSPWAFTAQDKALNRSLQFAIAAGCKQLDTASVVRCLQSKTSDEIRATMNVDATTFDRWSPVFDGQFITDDPVKALTGQYPSKDVEATFLGVDLIIGVNSKEGFNTYYWEFSNANFTTTDLDKMYIPTVLAESMKENVPAIVRNLISMEYKDWNHLNNKYKQFDRFVDLISDLKFNVPAAQTAIEHSIASNRTTFVYKLSTAPPLHSVPIDPHVDGPTVANHADDLTFLFDTWVLDDHEFPGGINNTITDEQRNIGKAMITLWTNFAKTGDPNQPVDVSQFINVSWPEYEKVNQNYLDLTPRMDSKSVKSRFAARAVAFWNVLIPSVLRTAESKTNID